MRILGMDREGGYSAAGAGLGRGGTQSAAAMGKPDVTINNNITNNISGAGSPDTVAQRVAQRQTGITQRSLKGVLT